MLRILGGVCVCGIYGCVYVCVCSVCMVYCVVCDAYDIGLCVCVCLCSMCMVDCPVCVSVPACTYSGHRRMSGALLCL